MARLPTLPKQDVSARRHVRHNAYNCCLVFWLSSRMWTTLYSLRLVVRGDTSLPPNTSRCLKEIGNPKGYSPAGKALSRNCDSRTFQCGPTRGDIQRPPESDSLRTLPRPRGSTSGTARPPGSPRRPARPAEDRSEGGQRPRRPRLLVLVVFVDRSGGGFLRGLRLLPSLRGRSNGRPDGASLSPLTLTRRAVRPRLSRAILGRVGGGGRGGSGGVPSLLALGGRGSVISRSPPWNRALGCEACVVHT